MKAEIYFENCLLGFIREGVCGWICHYFSVQMNNLLFPDVYITYHILWLSWGYRQGKRVGGLVKAVEGALLVEIWWERKYVADYLLEILLVAWFHCFHFILELGKILKRVFFWGQMLETMFGRVELAIFSGQAEHFSSFLHDNLLNFNIFPQVVILVDVVYIIQLIDLLDAEDEHPILLKRKFLTKFIQKFFQN